MTNSRHIIALVFAAAFAITPYFAAAGELPDTIENRMTAAERYLQVASMKAMMHDTVKEAAKTLPEGDRSVFIALMTDHVRVDVLENAALASMVRHFTVGELNALADFYGSPDGKSVMKKFGVYLADILPIVQQEIIRASVEIQAKMQNSRSN